MSVATDPSGFLRRDELVLRDGIWHRLRGSDASEYKLRWETEAKEDHVRSATASTSPEASFETLTTKISPIWQRLPRGRDLGRVLEIGAGYGRIPLYLARVREATWRAYVAVDISETMLARLVDYRRRFAPSDSPLHPVCVSAEELPLDDDTVDTVLSSAVFLHMGKDFVAGALREIARTLKPGGSFVFDVSFPNALNPPNLIPRLKPRRLRPPNFMKYWTHAEIETLLARSGLAAKAAPYVIEAGAHAILPKRVGPVPVPLARRANRLAERMPGVAQRLVTSSYTVYTPGLFT